MKYDIDTRYRFSTFVKNYVATGLVMMTCEELECYWVLDVIASYSRRLQKLNADYLKIVTVTLNKDNDGCVFKIDDEINGNLVTQEIEFTDLKEDLKWWLITEGEYEVLLLPSEY